MAALLGACAAGCGDTSPYRVDLPDNMRICRARTTWGCASCRAA